MRRAAAACALCACVPAAELVVRDVRLGVAYLPHDFDYTLTAPQGEFKGSDSFSSTYGITLGADWSLVGAGKTHGLVLGGELLAARVTGTGASGTLYGARGEVGYQWAVTDRWSLAAFVLGGYGVMSFDLQGAGAFPTYTSSGSWLDYGAEARVEYAFTDQALLGLAVGYQSINSDLSGKGIKLKMDFSGPAASLMFTWRFRTAPAPLE